MNRCPWRRAAASPTVRSMGRGTIVRFVMACCFASGCGGGPTAERVNTPDGRPGYLVRCRDPGDCMRVAGRVCAAGYRQLDRASTTEGKAFATKDVAWASVETTGVLMFECRAVRDPGNVCGGDPARWKDCKRQGGVCRPDAEGTIRCVNPEAAR